MGCWPPGAGSSKFVREIRYLNFKCAISQFKNVGKYYKLKKKKTPHMPVTLKTSAGHISARGHVFEISDIDVLRHGRVLESSKAQQLWAKGWGAMAEVLLSPGFHSRMRTLVVIPITMGVLFAVLLVSACISECPGGEVMGQEGQLTGHLFSDLALPTPHPFLPRSLGNMTKKKQAKVGHPGEQSKTERKTNSLLPIWQQN